MKKIVFLATIVFVIQSFYMNTMGQSLTQNYSNYIFKINGEESMILRKRNSNGDVSLYFPVLAWNRMITKGDFSFTAGDRGINDNLTDLYIHGFGNVGIGTINVSEKLNVAGNLKLESGGKLISNTELEFNPLNNNPISFNLSGLKGLQMKNGKNNDFTLLLVR
jgi:hypothetical protein